MALARDLIDAAALSVQRVKDGGPTNAEVGEFASLARKNDAECALKLVQAYVTLNTGVRGR